MSMIDIDQYHSFINDPDPLETREWLDALNSVIKVMGKERAEFLLTQLMDRARTLGIESTPGITTPYVNTLAPAQQIPMPDDAQLLTELTSVLRWNAIAMVMKAGKISSELGGHLSSYAGMATLFEVGLNYFFHAASKDHGGDLVYFQAHSSPGIYARAFLEGRLTEEHLHNFRQEIGKKGVSSYPHPWLMPNFWQFPTVSMGLGPLMAIYQARLLKYLHHRELIDTIDRKVWCFIGDGETGEPESLGALNIAARENLDNLIFIIGCNLQRLDGPVYGNGQIIQEMEGVFRGAGWNVIKVIWGSGWDSLFAKDKSGILLKRISELVDGEYQNYSAQDGSYIRENFFGKYPELSALVADMTDAEIKALQDGGHDPQKVYAAFAAASAHTGQPTVILAKTVKGYGLGLGHGEGQNIAHNQKKMAGNALLAFRDRFELPLSDEQVENLAFYKPDSDSTVMHYLREQREKLGGVLPNRQVQSIPLKVPPLSAFEVHLKGTEDREISTTMVYVRILNLLLKDANIGKYVIPIVADESRTFGMEGLFRQIGIYASQGQRYVPEDKSQLLHYREAQNGQLMQEGISEAGGMASWTVAATSYANNQLPLIPCFIYYSQFGFQRVGDLVWAAGDSRARGFIFGATAGRTTLAGEGLQHQDGANLIMYSFVPNCVTYDPAFGYELAVIMQRGLVDMYEEQRDVFYYITLMNENYVHPAMPKEAEEGIIKGMYLLSKPKAKLKHQVQLLGAGTILREVMAAAEILAKDYDVSAKVWSVPSFSELRRDLLSVQRYNLLHPKAKQKVSYVRECLGEEGGPVIAATDYMKVIADQLRSEVAQPFYVLGTDGYGRSDTRVALREFFEVDAKHIVYTTLRALVNSGEFSATKLQNAMSTLGIDASKPDPVTM